MSILNVLIAARARISDRSEWCKGAEARNAQGASVDPRSPAAVRWCATGALAREGEYDPAFPAAVAAIAWAIADFLPAGRVFVSAYNDDDRTTHEDILALYDRAIARAREKERGGK